jgi:phosphatidate cytidylyltransferase
VTFTRVLTAAALVPVVVAVVWWGPAWLVAVVVAAVLVLALAEFFSLAGKAGLAGHPRWTAICGLWLVYEQWAAGTVARFSFREFSLERMERLALPLEVVLLGFALGLLALIVFGRRPLKEALPGAGASAAALLLVALPLSYLVRLHGVERRGRELLLFALVLVWLGDTLAYFVGRAVGRLPLAPEISPKKTWEGAAGNLVGALVAGGAFAWWLKAEPAPWLMAAALANVAGQFGDLAESAFKRGAGVKDSGTLLPGHGGLLDRIDSLIFAAPVVWCYFWFVREGRF